MSIVTDIISAHLEDMQKQENVLHDQLKIIISTLENVTREIKECQIFLGISKAPSPISLPPITIEKKRKKRINPIERPKGKYSPNGGSRAVYMMVSQSGRPVRLPWLIHNLKEKGYAMTETQVRGALYYLKDTGRVMSHKDGSWQDIAAA